MPQRSTVISDFKKQIDETLWIITCVRNSLSSGSYTSQISLETHQGTVYKKAEKKLRKFKFKKKEGRYQRPSFPTDNEETTFS